MGGVRFKEKSEVLKGEVKKVFGRSFERERVKRIVLKEKGRKEEVERKVLGGEGFWKK